MNLPGNIYERLFDSESTVWQQAQTSSMRRFLAEYSLHDSQWLGLETEIHGEAVALVDWDLVWVNWEVQRIDIPRVTLPNGGVTWASPAYLAIQFTRLYYMATAHRQGVEDFVYLTLDGAETQPVSAEQREKFLGFMLEVLGEKYAEFALDEFLHRTMITGGLGDSIALYHAE